MGGCNAPTPSATSPTTISENGGLLGGSAFMRILRLIRSLESGPQGIAAFRSCFRGREKSGDDEGVAAFGIARGVHREAGSSRDAVADLSPDKEMLQDVIRRKLWHIGCCTADAGATARIPCGATPCTFRKPSISCRLFSCSSLGALRGLSRPGSFPVSGSLDSMGAGSRPRPRLPAERLCRFKELRLSAAAAWRAADSLGSAAGRALAVRRRRRR